MPNAWFVNVNNKTDNTTPIPTMSTFHLKGLNTYRAVAALIVLIGHVELFKDKFGFASFKQQAFFKFTGGHIAVILFFALSGYLITALLLREKDKYKAISLKQFYLRRIFRVWPLYYIIILLSFLIFDYSPSLTTVVLCLTVFPNVAHAMGLGWAVSPHIWSIGVEEQFYIGWPWIVKKSSKFLLVILIFIFLFFTALPHVLLALLNRVYPNPELLTFVNNFFWGTKFNCMAIGGIMAVLYHQKSVVVKWLNYNKVISYAFILLPFVCWFTGFHVNYVTDEMFSVMFAISILNVSTNPNVIDIDTKVGTFLGTISYGIYMYHWIILELFFRNDWLSFQNSLSKNILLYVCVIGVTILVSTISYYFVEKFFLNIKEKYTRS